MEQFDFTGPFEVLARFPDSSIHLALKNKRPVREMKGPAADAGNNPPGRFRYAAVRSRMHPDLPAHVNERIYPQEPGETSAVPAVTTDIILPHS
jgi:hypothetical protein